MTSTYSMEMFMYVKSGKNRQSVGLDVSCLLAGPRMQLRVCVFLSWFSSHSFWTSSSLDVPAGVTQEEGHTGFFIHLLSAVRALIFGKLTK